MLSTIVERADSRWNVLAADRPDLGRAITLQRALVGTLAAAGDALTRAGRPLVSLSSNHVAAKLAAGRPALLGESIGIPTDVLKPFLLEFCEHLDRGGAGKPARHIAEAIVSNRLDAESLLGASLARDQPAFCAGATQLGLSADLLWVVGELGAGPLAFLLQRLVLASDSGTATSRALSTWRHGYCPACGSWPVFAEAVGDVRSLRCSFCCASWRADTTRGCVYCGTDGELFASESPDAARVDRCLELCGHCKGYVKRISVAAPTPFPLLTIEDLATTDLDLLAAERGYLKPRVRDWRTAPLDEA